MTEYGFRIGIVGSAISTALGTAVTIGDLHHIVGIVGILFGMAMSTVGVLLQTGARRRSKDE